MAVSQAFIFHFKCYSILHFAVCQLPCWAFLFKLLLCYEDKAVSKAAVKAFSKHLWYLNEVLVSFAFFDRNICLAIKRGMVKSLDLEGSEDSAQLIEINPLTAVSRGSG